MVWSADVEVRFDANPALDRPIINVESISADADPVLVTIIKGHHVAERDELAFARLLIPPGLHEMLADAELQQWRSRDHHGFAEGDLNPNGFRPPRSRAGRTAMS